MSHFNLTAVQIVAGEAPVVADLCKWFADDVDILLPVEGRYIMCDIVGINRSPDANTLFATFEEQVEGETVCRLFIMDRNGKITERFTMDSPPRDEQKPAREYPSEWCHSYPEGSLLVAFGDRFVSDGRLYWHDGTMRSSIMPGNALVVDEAGGDRWVAYLAARGIEARVVRTRQ